ncbi:MAG: DUF2703 domain-containing protein [Patescibacteria group bacterium]
MKIQLIRNEGCHIWQTTEKELAAALAQAGIPPEYEIVVVRNNEDATRYRFFGSPQITINGKDLDSTAEQFSNYQALGCRIYLWQGKMYEYPPKEMIIEAIKRLGS